MTGTKRKNNHRPQPEISYDLAIYLAWQRGLLDYKLLPHQKDLFAILGTRNSRKICINSSRRFGKTTSLLIYAFKFGIKNPGSLIRFVAPTQKALRKNIFPIIKDILADCPVEFLPKWDTQNSCYVFPNGTEFHLYGTDSGQADSLRGQRTELAIIDEAAFVQDGTLRYIVQDVLLPQTLTCNGRIILASTPQKYQTQSGEEFRDFCNEAKMVDAYHTKTIYENTSLSEALIAEYCKESGGKHSITWRVEYCCEFIIDPEKRILPEWDTAKHVEDIPNPQMFGHYHKYVAMDLGVKRDFTVMLFGYYDFHKAKLVILDEHKMKNMTSQELIDDMKAKEEFLFSNFPVYRRVADTDNPLLLNDMAHIHGLPIIPTTKSTLETMVNELRIFIDAGKLVVHPRCKFLAGSLENAVWANNAAGRMRKDFSRSPTYGHFDALAALMYLVRNVDVHSNPIPADHGVDAANMFVVKDRRQEHELSKLFKRK